MIVSRVFTYNLHMYYLIGTIMIILSTWGWNQCEMCPEYVFHHKTYGRAARGHAFLPANQSDGRQEHGRGFQIQPRLGRRG